MGPLFAGNESALETYEAVKEEGEATIYTLTDRQAITLERDGSETIKSVNYTNPSVAGVQIEKAGPAESEWLLIFLGVLIGGVGFAWFLDSAASGLATFVVSGALGTALVWAAYQTERDSHEVQLLTDDDETNPMSFSIPPEGEEFVDTVHRTLGVRQ